MLITTNGSAPKLFRLDAPDGVGWVQIRLEGPDSNRQGIGSLVEVFSGDRRQRWYVTGSGSYLTQSAVDRHTFGLGAASAADSVRIVWPDGRGVVRTSPVAAGSTLTLKYSEAP